MTSKQRAYLRGLANDIDPVVQIGREGVTPESVGAVYDAFHTRELIKLSVQKNCTDDPYEIADRIADRTHSQVIQVIGRKIVLYRPDKKNPKIILPKSKRGD